MAEASLTAGTELAVRLGAFLSVFALMAAWELAAPARPRRLARVARWRANLGLAVVNTLVLRVALPGSAIALAALAHEQSWGLLNRFALPAWAAVLLGVLLLDLIIYFQHVLFHAVPVLARLHAVHHADPDFDLTTGIRFHPVEMLLSALIKFAAVVVLGLGRCPTLPARLGAARRDRGVRGAGVNELSVRGAHLVDRQDLMQRAEAVIACDEQRGERGHGADPRRNPSPSRRTPLCHAQNQSTRGPSPQAQLEFSKQIRRTKRRSGEWRSVS